MSSPHCIHVFCFFNLSENSQKFFGFSEFLTGLAFMVLAWTTVDFRYRFRLRVASIPLLRATFSVVTFVGIATLLTDLWRAEQLPVPYGHILTPASWQAFLGGLFFLTFLIWSWFAFFRTPLYGKRNADKFMSTLYHTIIKGSSEELAIASYELTPSIPNLIKFAGKWAPSTLGKNEGLIEKPTPYSLAYEILLLIPNERFCKAIVDASPNTAWAFFDEAAKTKNGKVPIGQFGRNIFAAALSTPNSFIYNEADSYYSGLLGYHKPVSQALFGNYPLVERADIIFDQDANSMHKWPPSKWSAYFRAALITFEDYVAHHFWEHSFVLNRTLGYVEYATSELYKLDGVTGFTYDNEEYARLRAALDFLLSAVDILNKYGAPAELVRRLRGDEKFVNRTIYDTIADISFDIGFATSRITKPSFESWHVQHNVFWQAFYNSNKMNGPAGAIVKFKIRRLFYDEITRMVEMPNFKGAAILRVCLNVLGLRWQKHDRESRSLHKVILAWVVRNFSTLHAAQPNVAAACLPENVYYDAVQSKIIKIMPVQDLRPEPTTIELEIDRPLQA